MSKDLLICTYMLIYVCLLLACIFSVLLSDFCAILVRNSKDCHSKSSMGNYQAY